MPILLQPQVRNDLQSYLVQLQADDPRPLWRAEHDRGIASGIDEVFHFFFDDHDFDESAVGFTLRGQSEVQLVEAVKQALEAVLHAVGDRGDDAFVLHPLWTRVKEVAGAATIGIAWDPHGS